MELKSSDEGFIKINNITYTKNDLIESFDFFDKEENWDIAFLSDKYPFIKSLDTIGRINFVLKLPDSFLEDPNNLKIRKYLTNAYKETIHRELRSLIKEDNFIQLRFLASYFKLLTNEVQDEFHVYIKSQIEAKIRWIKSLNYKVGSTGKAHYSFSTHFVELAGIVGDDDPDFLVDILNLVVEIYNKNRIPSVNFIACMKAHLNLSHLQQNKQVIEDNIRSQKKSLNRDRDGGFSFSGYNIGWSAVWIAIVVIRLVVKCEQSSNNYTPSRIHFSPQVEMNDSIYDLIKDNRDTIFSDTTSYPIEVPDVVR